MTASFPHARRIRRWMLAGALASAMVGTLVLAHGCASESGQQTAATKPAKPAPVGGIGGTGFANNGVGGTGMGPQAPGGIGGTGQPQNGIGGTGVTPNGVGGTGLAQNGIGGTGLKDWGRIGGNGVGGTGIVGVITGFGSIWVNGVEVALDASTTVQINGAPAKAGDLAMGQWVAIQAQGPADMATARSVAAAPLVQGPVQAADAATGTLTVAGQAVHVSANTSLASGAFPAVGSWVRINGLVHSDGTLEASRVFPADAQQVRLAGMLRADGIDWKVDGVPLQLGAGVSTANLADTAVVVTGDWKDGTLVATGIAPDPVAALMARVAQVSIQGYLQAGNLRVGSLTFPVRAAPGTAAASPTASGEQLVVVSGQMAPDHSIQATGITVLSMGPSSTSTPAPAATSTTSNVTGTSASPASPPKKPFFAGTGNPWGGPPAAPPRGPPPGVPGIGGPPPGHGPPCGTPPCGGPPPGHGNH